MAVGSWHSLAYWWFINQLLSELRSTDTNRWIQVGLTWKPNHTSHLICINFESWKACIFSKRNLLYRKKGLKLSEALHLLSHFEQYPPPCGYPCSISVWFLNVKKHSQYSWSVSLCIWWWASITPLYHTHHIYAQVMFFKQSVVMGIYFKVVHNFKYFWWWQQFHQLNDPKWF